MYFRFLESTFYLFSLSLMLYLSLRKGSDYCQRIDILLLNKLKRICFNNFGLIFFNEQTLTQKKSWKQQSRKNKIQWEHWITNIHQKTVNDWFTHEKKTLIHIPYVFFNKLQVHPESTIYHNSNLPPYENKLVKEAKNSFFILSQRNLLKKYCEYGLICVDGNLWKRITSK